MHLKFLHCFSSRNLPAEYEGPHDSIVRPLVPQASQLVHLALLWGIHEFGTGVPVYLITGAEGTSFPAG